MLSQLKSQLKRSAETPKTDDELWNFIYDTWGIRIPRNAVVAGHSAPFQFVADAFFEREQNIIAFANRNGGKTLDFAILEVLDSIFKDKCETGHVAAIRTQANKGYRYFLDFIRHPKIWPYVASSIQSETRFSNSATVQILTGTVSGVNSPHPHKAKADEVELMDWDVIQEFFSMAKSGDGIKAQNILTSTRKYIYGSMQRILNLIKQGEMPGWKIYHWNIFDIMEPYTEKDLEKFKDLVKNSSSGNNTSFYDEFIPYVGKTDGFYSLEDAAQKFSTMSLETWETQWTNRVPSREGLIYFMFDSDKHTKDLEYHHWFEHFVGQDFGTSNPNVALLIEYDPTTEIYYVLDEDYSYRTAITDAAEQTYIDIAKDYKVEGWICDPRGAGQILEINKKFVEAGLDEIAEAAPSTLIEDGIELIRSKLRDGKLFIDRSRCPKLIEEIEQLYHYKEGTDKPEKKDDHGPDALRYFLEWHQQFVGQTIITTISKGGLYNR